MQTPSSARLIQALDPFRLRRWLILPRVRAVLAWTVAVLVAVVALDCAWHDYDVPGRPDGTVGHTYIDFSGQWIMGRMLARGEGADLYHRERIREALRDAYGPDDADHITDMIIESDDQPGVGGPLYPPIQALLFYPLGLLQPLWAYRIVQILNILLTFGIGFLVWMQSRGRIWASVAAGAVMAFPGWNGAICLGQNPLVSLALLTLGWLLIARDRPWLGGVVWGLLAFKPVWAAAFFLVPLLSGRWRVCAAMLLTGLVLIAATLPFVGVPAWLDWVTVGRAATAHYARDESWIFLSRDLQGIPRRWMLTFAEGVAVDPERLLPNILGWRLWMDVILLTVLVPLRLWRRPAGLYGPPAAFLMLGAWLSCFHFMYYDVMLAALPVCVLVTGIGWGEGAGPRREAPRPAPGDVLTYPTDSMEDILQYRWIKYVLPLALIALLFTVPHIVDGIDYLLTNGHPTFHYPPFDTFFLLALWAWCGWRWLFQNDG